MAIPSARISLADGPEAVRRAGEGLARESGRPVCGYVSASAPVEMIEAAGLLPIEITCDAVSDTPAADTLMENLFHPVVRRTFEAAMTGGLDWLSAIVLPRSSDAPHRLFYYLSELRRTGAAAPLPLLFDIVQTPGEASEAYALGRIRHLWSQLCAIGNPAAGDADLIAAISRSIQRRDLLNRLVERRQAGPENVPGAVALAAFAASRALPHEVFVNVLGRWLAAGPTAVLSAGPRVVIAGSPQEGGGLASLIEASGGLVVGDFHGAGELSIGAPAAPGPLPLEALTSAWRESLAGNRAFADPAEAILSFSRSAGASGVIFSYLPEEEALPWDYPAQAQALAGAGIATLRLGDQSTPFDIAAAEPMVRPFIASLVRRPPA